MACRRIRTGRSRDNNGALLNRTCGRDDACRCEYLRLIDEGILHIALQSRLILERPFKFPPITPTLDSLADASLAFWSLLITFHLFCAD